MSLSSWGSTLSDFDNGDSHVNDTMLRTPTPTSVQSSQADVVQVKILSVIIYLYIYLSMYSALYLSIYHPTTGL